MKQPPRQLVEELKCTTQIVSVNNGSEAELESLLGVGPATSLKIMSNRPYSDLSELVHKVMSQSLFTKIKDLISL